VQILLTYTIVGLVSGAVYAVAAGGLVLTYATSRIFNVAHGATGMVMAFCYWELAEHHHLPQWLALLLVVGVVAPAFGAVVERVLMRRLADAPVGVTLVVTVGLFVALFGAATALWPPAGRTVRPFLAGHGLTVGGVFVGAHDLLTVLAAVGVAAGLYLLLNRTRVGIAMRACVDDRELLALFGGRPVRVSTLSWAVGSSLAALAGILLAPTVQLNYIDLTLLVINAYAAAVLGRLSSLPLTFAGAVALGLLQSYAVGYLPTSGALIGLRAAIPTLFLAAVLVFLPRAPLRVGQVAGIAGVPVPAARRAAVAAGVLVLVVWLGSAGLPDVQLARGALGFAYGIVMLSLVLLTGYGGHVSLGQLTFVGVGAVVVARLGTPSPLALLAATAVAAVVGALVALPSVRLHGLYLALTTLAFAQLMDKLVFQSSLAFGYNGSLSAQRLSVGGVRFGTERAYLVLTAAAFGLVGLLVLALRRGRYGRLVVAVRDSPAAAATLGLDVRWNRVGLFALSAGIAGLAGGLFAGLRQTVSATDFQLFNSLPLLLLAVVGGVTSVTGAAVGGMLLMLLPVVQSGHPGFGGVAFLAIGLVAAGLGRDPNGLASLAFRAGRAAFGGRAAPRPAVEATAEPATARGA
jgi:branched-chain amino acid transport system permease protein